MKATWLVLMFLFPLAVVAQTPGTVSGPKTITFDRPETAAAPHSISVHSNDFNANEPIPDKNSSYGDDRSPNLGWMGAPARTKSLVLMVEDPDGGGSELVIHWLVANLAPETMEIPSSQPPAGTLPQFGGAVQGTNQTGKLGYHGPHPPAGDPPHHYHFQIFAVDTMLRLPAGFTRVQLLDALRGHVLAKGELVGTYERKVRPENPEPAKP